MAELGNRKSWTVIFSDHVDVASWNVCDAKGHVHQLEGSSFIAVVNSRHVYKLRQKSSSRLTEPSGNQCITMELSKSAMSKGIHKVALYTEGQKNSNILLLHLGTITKSSMIMSTDGRVNHLHDLAASTKPLVGILYGTWHAGLGAKEMQDCVIRAKASNSTCPTTEYVVRYSQSGSDSIRIKDMSSWWNVTPKKGFYCIYRKRPGESGLVPDCPNITETLTDHARELLQAGIDYVALDGTNLYKWPDTQSDLIQLRPTEVLFEEWAKLREKGLNTPKIVIWNVASNGSVLWKQYLDRFYNSPNRTYQDLLLLNNIRTGKKVFMVPDKPKDDRPSPTIVSAIESNGGRNDIDVVKVWALKGPDSYANGTWGFMTPCGEENYTTTVQSRTECNQRVTYNSPMGSAIAVSPAYQINYASEPFGSPSKLGGLTFKLQFKTALTKMPNNFFISSFNEFYSRPKPNAWGGAEKRPWVTSVGLEWDPDRYSGWVDTFGAYRSRDIEPTLEYGDLFYDIMSSCLRVLALNSATNTMGCMTDGEICCDVEKSRQFKPIWSLRTLLDRNDLVDFLFTDDENEKNNLTGINGNYKEICALERSVDTFCSNESIGESIDAARGPFILFSLSEQYRVPLYRCRKGTVHLFSIQEDCEGLGVKESQLGWISTNRDSQTARSLYRCKTATDKNEYYFPLLDNACPTSTTEERLMGYVV